MQRPLRLVITAVFLMLWAAIAVAQTYTQQGNKLVGSGGISSSQNQGYAVALSADGNTAIVGARNDDDNHGAAYIYRRTGTTWTQQAKLVGTIDNPADNFPNQGYAVDISDDGNTVIIGGYKNILRVAGGAKQYVGAAWIFVYNGNAWVEQKVILGTVTGEYLGYSVSLNGNGNVALIGGGAPDDQGESAGEIWERNGVTWTKQATLVGSDQLAGGNNPPGLVRAVAVTLSADGNTALIGSADDGGVNGAAWIFARNGSTWVQQSGKLLGGGDGSYGCSVSLSADGSTAFVGERALSFVYAYKRTGNTWGAAIDRMRAIGPVANPFSGWSVSCSADGSVVLIGGAENDPSGTGAAWVFVHQSSGNWTSAGSNLVGTGGVGQPRQGVAVALSADGKTALVGGTGDNTGIGAAWVFVQTPMPTIDVGPVTGTITACEHSASANPKIQQFTVTGTLLTDDITVSAPPGFDISLNANDGYNTTLVIPQNPNSPGNASATVYVRASSLATAGPIAGDVLLGSTGAIAKSVPVSGTVYAIATADQKTLPAYTVGRIVPAITFTGNADSYNWTSDNQSIGLSASSGTNSIPSFTAVNDGTTIITAHIRVTPVNSNGCSGADMLFDLVIMPAGPVIDISPVTGTITACKGTPSADPLIQQFTISGNNLTDNIVLTPPANFELSASPGGGYVNVITLTPLNGIITTKTIYVRSAATAPAGPISGMVTISSGSFNQSRQVSGVIKNTGNINTRGPQVFVANTTHDIVWGGTATTVNWTNDNPAIGFAASGSGNIHFTATNAGTTDIIANIEATPVSEAACNGEPVRFTITVRPALEGGINTSGSLPPLIASYGTPSNVGSFRVGGDDMMAGITVTPPPGFEVSIDDNTFSQTLTVGAAGTIPQTRVYIRLAKTTPVGTYPGDVLLSSTGTADGKISLDNNNTITPAALTITADNKSKTIGTENPLLTVTYSGFVNSENASVLTTPPAINTTAVLDSPPGTYPITASGAVAANYTITYIDGSMTVKPPIVNIVINNTFTPNGDGLNDTWIIKNIEEFPNSVVQIFNRYGTPVFYSVSYPKPWDGKSNGADLPVGTYYYVIDLKNGDKPASGWVAIIR